MVALVKKHKNLIPLLILGIASIYTILNYFFNRSESDGIVYSYALSYENYLGFLAVVLNFLVYFLLRRQFKKVIIITMALGILGIFKYLPIELALNFGIIDSFTLTIEIFSFCIGLLYFLLNYRSLFRKTTNEEELPDLNKVLDFKEKYAHKEDQELLEIVEDKRFTIEAKQAAAELLKKAKT
jgi:hypothetical protein